MGADRQGDPIKVAVPMFAIKTRADAPEMPADRVHCLMTNDPVRPVLGDKQLT